MIEHTASFSRNRWITAAMPVIAAVALFVSVFYFVESDIGIAAVWLLMAVIWYFNYRWSSRTPFIVLSRSGLAIRSSPLAPAKEIPWHTVINAQQSGPYRLTLYLTSGRKFSIYLTWIGSKDKKLLIQMLGRAVTEKGAHSR